MSEEKETTSLLHGERRETAGPPRGNADVGDDQRHTMRDPYDYYGPSSSDGGYPFPPGRYSFGAWRGPPTDSPDKPVIIYRDSFSDSQQFCV
jgi:hypothetical protein